MSMNKMSFLFMALLALVIAGHLLFFVGFTAADDILYLTQAERYSGGDFSLPERHWGFRYTAVLPVALLDFFGAVTEYTLAAVQLAYWIALLALVLWFAQRQLGFEAAAYAGLLIASLPLFVVQSSILGVDIAEAFFLTTSTLLFFLAESERRYRYGFYFAAGVALGLAMLNRETAYGFLVIFGLFFVFGGYRRWVGYLAGLAGVGLILGCEWLYYLSFDQGPLYRLETVTHSHGGGLGPGDFDAGTGNVSDSQLTGPLLAVLLNQEFALLYWVAAIAAVYLYRHASGGDRQLFKYVGVILVLYFLWLGYSGTIRSLPRYFSFPSVLAIVLIAMMLAQMKSRWQRGLLLLAIVGANAAALSVENIHPRFAARTIAEFSKESDVPIVAQGPEPRRARGLTRLIGGNAKLILNWDDQSGTFVFAALEDVAPPPEIAALISDDHLVKRIEPPKLLVGHILDFSGIASMLPTSLYSYLAIRNPTVRFYRIAR